MPFRNYEIHVRADSVDVRWDTLNRPKWICVLGCAAIIGTEAALVYFLLFTSDPNGYSAWRRLMHDRMTSLLVTDLLIPVVCLISVSLFSALYGIRFLFPFGEKLNCNPSALSIATIP
jgi:hypothetical protein